MHYIIVDESGAFDWKLIKQKIKDNKVNTTTALQTLYFNEQILAELSQQSIFFVPEVTIIKDVDFLSSAEKIKEHQDIIEYLKADKEIIYLLFTTKKVSKTFNEPDFKIITIEPLTKKNKQTYIENLLHQANLQCSPELIETFIQKVNEDYRVINFECQKINLLKQIGADDDTIMAALSSYNEENIFSLLTAILKKDKASLFKIYESIKNQKEDEIKVIAIIASQLNQALLYKRLVTKGMSSKMISEYLQVTPYVIFNLEKITSGVELKRIQSLMETLLNLELDIKQMRIDKVLGFKNFLVNI